MLSLTEGAVMNQQQPKTKRKFLDVLVKAFQILSKPKSDLDFNRWLYIESRQIRNLERKRQMRDWREMEK